MKLRPILMAASFVAMSATFASANEELAKLSSDANQWVMPSGNYSAQRYSGLSQINQSNVGKLHVAWTFSTGVLRGHEGGPLVIGN